MVIAFLMICVEVPLSCFNFSKKENETMDLLSGAIFVTAVAIRQHKLNSRKGETARLSVRSAELIATAEMEVANHEKATVSEYNRLIKMTQGIIGYLENDFYEVLRPFDTKDCHIRENIIGAVAGIETEENLSNLISCHASIISKPEIEKNTMGRVSGTTLTTAYLLFGQLRVSRMQVDAARTQKKKAELLADMLPL